jgi:CRISPR-associated protein Csc3
MSQQDEIGREAADQILGSFGTNVQEESAPTALKRYRDEVDPKLVNAGWGFELAKSVDHNKIDQSLVNHVRCGVFALARMNEIVETAGGYTLSDDRLRDVIALFVLHDIHKLDAERDDNPKTRFDIPKSEAEAYAERFGLYEFAGTDDKGLLRKMFHDCAIDHHDDWTAYTDQTSVEFDERRPFVRLADAFASSETPEQATDEQTQSALCAAYPGENFALRHHLLDDVKGVLTNLVNNAVADTLARQGYEKLLLYQDGCVYFLPEDGPEATVDDALVTTVFDELKDSVQDAHEAYRDATKLRDNLAFRSQGFYGINNQDFFYAGAATVLEAVVLKCVNDADPEEGDLSDTMIRSIEGLEPHMPFDIDRTYEPIGLGRLVDTVRRSFVDPVLNTNGDDRDSLTVTCEVFGVSDTVCEGLQQAAQDESVDLNPNGGGWYYGYGIGQALVETNEIDPDTLTVRIADGLSNLSEDWHETVETEHASHIQTELEAYLGETVSIDDRKVTIDKDTHTDIFEQYGGSRRGKICDLCNRRGRKKEDMKAPKSLTTLKSGYSNHIAVDSGDPDNLIVCNQCQIELSLREAGSAHRNPDRDRLFIHLVPDYFYTPLSWRSYTRLTGEFSGNSKTELGGLAESILALGEDDEALGDFVASMFDEEHGRSMIETLDQGFDPDAQFGARTLGYFKPNDHDTEFQFFGVFAALAIAAYSGLRVAVSESPIPDVRGRDFRKVAHVGGGFTQVHDFYGTEVPLSDLQSRLHAAAALIRLGYEHSPLVGKNDNPKDTMFAKYLRVTRNQLLPGSHLLKRIAQADDGGNAQYLLKEARVLDETTGLPTDS